jgi:hypothetical protein
MESRTEFSVGEIIRDWGGECCGAYPAGSAEGRVLKALAACRTASLGGHLEECDGCGFERPVYNSCGNRHCPLCQGKLARRWLQRQMADLLPVPYFHVVFTVPDTLNVLLPANARVLYGLLFRAARQALLHLAGKHLGGEPGFIAVLHTWGQTLWLHPHLHCIVTGGALSADRRRWVSSGGHFLFDVHELSAEFRKRFCRLLRRAPLRFGGESAHLRERPAFDAFTDGLEARPWVVFAKQPFAGPEQVLEYISRYTHRVAIANRRILDVAANGTVRFGYKDYRHEDRAGRPREAAMALPAAEFIRRFLLHVLPAGFRKIRFGGFLGSPAKSAKLAACRALLPAPAQAQSRVQEPAPAADPDPRLLCPRCGRGTMRPAGALPADAATDARPSAAAVRVDPVPSGSGASPPEVRHAA